MCGHNVQVIGHLVRLIREYSRVEPRPNILFVEGFALSSLPFIGHTLGHGLKQRSEISNYAFVVVFALRSCA